MTAGPTEKERHARPDERERFIPVRKKDVVNELALRGPLLADADGTKFLRLCRSFSVIFHYEYFDRLERMRDDYYYFNPDVDPHAQFDEAHRERTYAELVETLESVLQAAEFVEVSPAAIERAHREHAVLRVEVKHPGSGFRSVRFFQRGLHQESLEVADWFGLRKRKIQTDVHDDVIVVAAAELAQAAGVVAKRKARPKLRPGSVLLKHFRNIAAADLDALYPNVAVALTATDKLALVVPALIGIVPIILKLATTLTVLFVVVGAYLGVSAAVEGDKVKTAFAAVAALAAFGGFVMRQWTKYQSQSLKYQKLLADNFYFRNVANNTGIFDSLIGSAEEQEVKEAALAFYFLQAANAVTSEADLKADVEAWLRKAFGVDIDFAAHEVAQKLERFGLLIRRADRLSVLSLDAALAHLEEVWAGFHSDEGAEDAEPELPSSTVSDRLA